MKRIILLLAAGAYTLTLHAQEKEKLPFTLKGKIDDIGEPAKAILMYSFEGKSKSDTVEVTKGVFTINGFINKPTRSVLTIMRSSDNPMMRFGMGYGGEIIGRDGVTFYLDKGATNMNGKTVKTATISGSPVQKEFEQFQALMQPVVDKLTAINEEMKPYATDREGEKYKGLMEKLMSTMKEMGPVSDGYIKAHPDSWVAWDKLTGQSIFKDAKATQTLFNGMNARFRNSEDGKKFQERLQIAFTTSIGAQAPNFIQDDQDGKPVSLASLKGKYVLIDFWASWCGPCRAENPNVVKAYEKFKGKNFEILAVSLDNKKDAWLKAIADDGLPWLHVSDLKGWENEVAKQYNVRAVPQNWLVNPNGVIIAANMRGKELEDKLSGVLK